MAPRAARSYAPSPATTRRSRAAGGAAKGFSLGVDVLRGVTRPWSHCMEAPATTDGAGGAAESGRRHPAEGCAVLTPRGPLAQLGERCPCTAEVRGSTPLRSTTDLQVTRVLRALRETSRKACCNPSATEMRAFRWDWLGLVGADWDGATSRRVRLDRLLRLLAELPQATRRGRCPRRVCTAAQGSVKTNPRSNTRSQAATASAS